MSENTTMNNGQVTADSDEVMSLDEIMEAAGILEKASPLAKETCRLYISRTGKRQLVIDAYVGDNLAEILHSKGVDYAGLNFSREIGEDQLTPLGSVHDVTLGAGTHKLHANKNVIGGSKG